MPPALDVSAAEAVLRGEAQWAVVTADCIEGMRALPPNSVDGIVCDPPYGLTLADGGGDWMEDPSEVGGFQDGNGGNAFSRSRIRYGDGGVSEGPEKCLRSFLPKVALPQDGERKTNGAQEGLLLLPRSGVASLDGMTRFIVDTRVGVPEGAVDFQGDGSVDEEVDGGGESAVEAADDVTGRVRDAERDERVPNVAFELAYAGDAPLCDGACGCFAQAALGRVSMAVGAVAAASTPRLAVRVGRNGDEALPVGVANEAAGEAERAAFVVARAGAVHAVVLTLDLGWRSGEVSATYGAGEGDAILAALRSMSVGARPAASGTPTVPQPADGDGVLALADGAFPLYVPTSLVAHLEQNDGKGGKKGFMGRDWDGLGLPRDAYRWHLKWVREAFRVLKPGGHLIAFSGTRTYHRLACAVEDVGFEIRDKFDWLYAQGFPKSMDMTKAIDRELGVLDQRPVVGTETRPIGGGTYNKGEGQWRGTGLKTAPASDEAKKWAGWGTALKPAHEPAVIARKPLSEGTVAANVLKWGVGAMNIDAARIALRAGEDLSSEGDGEALDTAGMGWGFRRVARDGALGRWPTNLLLTHTDECTLRGTRKVKAIKGGATRVSGGGGFDGLEGERGGIGETHVPAEVGYGDADGLEEVEDWECHPVCPVRVLDEQSGVSVSRYNPNPSLAKRETDEVFGSAGFRKEHVFGPRGYDDQGGASRFFFCAKVSGDERNAGLSDLPDKVGGGLNATVHGDSRTGHVSVHKNTHPTLKPKALMLHLARLIVPRGGVVLDPFSGAGSAGCGVVPAGYRYIGFELSSEYAAIGRRRIEYWSDPKKQREEEARERAAKQAEAALRPIETPDGKRLAQKTLFGGDGA